jgi:hypothetical protein
VIDAIEFGWFSFVVIFTFLMMRNFVLSVINDITIYQSIAKLPHLGTQICGMIIFNAKIPHKLFRIFPVKTDLVHGMNFF